MLASKLDHLRTLFAEMGRVLVTFSGGVDSALVLRLAHDTLGDGALALTALSPTLAPEEGESARAFAAALGVRHEMVESHELETEGYARNEGNRCYFCKTELFALATDRARALGIPWVVDGTIVDDFAGHRPGLAAAGEHAVRHPLVEAGFTKSEVREAAKQLGLDVWDKPSFACLGSRFPAGTRVTAERIGRVQRIESVLRGLGLRQFRVRFHALDGADLARIEVDPASLAFLVSAGVREAVAEACRREGFAWSTIDLDGYRMGNGSVRAPV
jgi:uncharacterized protein